MLPTIRPFSHLLHMRRVHRFQFIDSERNEDLLHTSGQADSGSHTSFLVDIKAEENNNYLLLRRQTNSYDHF